MNKTLFSLGLFMIALLSAHSVFAQSDVSERSIKLDKKTEKNGFQMSVNSTTDIVAVAIEKKLKMMGVRYEDHKGTYVAKAATIGSISAKALDFTIIIDENRKSKVTTVSTIAMMGYDIVVNSRDFPTEAQNIKGFLTALREDIRVETLNGRVKEENDKLVEFERNFKKLTERKLSLEKEVQSYLEKAEASKNEAAKTATELDNMRMQVDNQRQAIEKIKKEF